MLQAGDVVLDPMCGNGLLLVEAAKENSVCIRQLFVIGMFQGHIKL